MIGENEFIAAEWNRQTANNAEEMLVFPQGKFPFHQKIWTY